MANRSQLIALVEDCASRAEDHPSLAHTSPQLLEYERIRRSSVRDSPEIERVGRAVLETAGLDPDANYRVRTGGGGSRSGGSGGRWLGNPVLAQALVHGAERAVTEMLDLLKANTVPMHAVVAIWGFQPTEGFDLVDDVSVQPMSTLGPSPNRDMALQIPPREANSALTQVVAKPRAAVVHSYTHGPLVVDAATTVDDADDIPDWDRLQDMTIPLTVALRRPVFPLAMWCQPQSAVPLLCEGGGMGQAIVHAFIHEHAPEEVDGAVCASAAENYWSLPDDIRRRLRLSVNRLRQTRTRAFYDERAVDLGIALEAALFGEKESINGEIKFRFRQRGTQLLGGSDDDRRNNWALLGKIYTLRSKVAHGGESPKENESDWQTIDNGIELGYNIASRLIHDGTPDYDAMAMGLAGQVERSS